MGTAFDEMEQEAVSCPEATVRAGQAIVLLTQSTPAHGADEPLHNELGLCADRGLQVHHRESLGDASCAELSKAALTVRAPQILSPLVESELSSAVQTKERT
jgi:hypothetical protein